MSIQLKNRDSLPSVEANLVPIHIQHNGPANTNEFFTTTRTQDESNGNAISFFRGLRLIGQPIPLPKNSTAFLVNKQEEMVAAPETPEGFKTVYNYVPEAKFNRITGYGHDSTLPTNSQYLLLNEWDDISNIVHE